VTREVVENPERELERLLQDPAHPEMMAKFQKLLSQEIADLEATIRNREPEFQKRYGRILSKGRVSLVAHRVVEKGYDVNTVLEEMAEVKRHVEELERDFERKQGIRVRFDEEAIDRVMEIALEEDGKGVALCSRLAKDYEHGMKLIRDKTGRREFVLTREAVDDPEGYLNQLIREIYSKLSEQTVEGRE
jgi:hypothetical protein